MRNILNKNEFKPVPMGDGQQLALRLQASRFYETYSFSFAEPWLGGEQPVRFSTSISQTKTNVFWGGKCVVLRIAKYDAILDSGMYVL